MYNSAPVNKSLTTSRTANPITIPVNPTAANAPRRYSCKPKMPSIMKKTKIDSAIEATLFNGFKWCMSSLVLSPNLSIDFLMKK